jgi:hypothetical protein
VETARRSEARGQLKRVTDLSVAAPAACPNCSTPLATPCPNFCSVCGQETTVRPPTLGEFAQQFGGAYFSTEGALWRTLRLLLFKPGELTRQYLAGRRKHYVLPLRLYLTVSVVVLLLLRVVATIQPGLDAAQAEALSELPRTLTIDVGFGRVELKDGVFTCEDLPQWLCDRFQSRMVLDPKAMIKELRLVGERLTGNWGSAMFVLMPSFAFGLWYLYRDRRMRYTEHLVFALHLHAFWFVALALLEVGFVPVQSAALLAIPVYAVLAMRRVYGGAWGQLAWRASVLFLAYSLLVLLAIVILVLIALLA